MKRFCTVLFSAAVLLAAVLSASCSDGGSSSQGGGGTAPGAGEEGSRDTIILHAQYPYIYVWESGVSGLDNKQSEMKAEGNGWYYFEIKSSSAKVIFKPNADDDWSGQTEDLYAIAGEWWYNGSELSDTKPSGGQSDTKLSAPENVTATASGSSSITVSWDAVDGADRYIVYYRSYSGTDDACKRNGTEKTKSTENTSVLIQQLEHKNYLFWVTAENSAGESEESMWDYAMPNSSSGSGGSSTTTTLSAPTGLYATAASSSSVRLTWNSVSGATKYWVLQSEYSSSATASVIGSTTSTSTTVTGLKANTKYYFWICAANSTTTSDYSTSDYATTEAEASWTPPTIYQELTNLGADNAIIGNVSAGNVYWFRLYASQPSSSTYTYTISFLDEDASSSYSSDVVATYYNQNGTVYASEVDNGLFGRSCSYLLSQYLYVKVECKKSGSFAIYAERKK